MYFAPHARSGLTSLFCWMLLFLLPLVSATRLSAEMVDKVVAVVNDDIITLSELEKEGERAFRKIASTTPPDQLQARLAAVRSQVLDAMIDQRLIDQKAAAKNITVSEAEIDAAYGEVMRRTGMSREQLLQKVEDSGMDEASYRSTLRSQLLQNKLLGSDVSAKVIITDEMILDYYDNHYVARQAGPARKPVASGSYYLLQIGCSWQSGGQKQEALNRARKARELALAGEDFGKLARQFSDLPSKMDGGDIGTFELDELAADMRGAIAGLAVGEISEIIETPAGFQFFKVVSGGAESAAQPAGNLVAKAPLEQVREAIRQELYEQEMRKAYAEWVKDLKSQAYIQKL